MRADLPIEAVSINGQFIEDLISGYKTVITKGREALELTLDTYNTNTADGEKIRGSRYPARTITVDFALTGTSLPDLRSKLTRLNEILSRREPVNIVFNDEDGYYFNGIPVMKGDANDYKNSMTGKYEIYCADPFKYSAEQTVTPVNKKFTVNYQGTYKTYPTLVASFPATRDSSGNNTNTSECGFVGFANQAGKILQFGDPEEKDWGDIPTPATTPLNFSFSSLTGWTKNGSAVIDGYTVTGTAAVTGGHVYASGYGSGSNMHGPTVSKVLSDSSTAKNFTFSWTQKFAVTNKKQFGSCLLVLWRNNSGTRTRMAAVSLYKTKKDNNCRVIMYIGSSKAGEFIVACSKVGACSIKKVGSTITFSVAGTTKSYSDSSISDLIVNEVTMFFGKWKSSAVINANYITNCKLQRHAYSSKGDIENTFQPGDVLTVKTEDASVYLDSGEAQDPAPYLGALGNDWEDFVLTPGNNEIEIDYSDFATTAPEFELRYRERFL